MHTPPAGWKRTIVHELIEYGIDFAYLAFFLVAFTWYRRLILAEYQIPYTDYWFPVIEAAILAKVIMIGDLLRLGRRLEDRPLIFPTLFRTAAFSVWVGLFNVLEATVKALLHGKGVMGGFEEIASRGRYELLARCLVILVAFLPFFAFKELQRVLGERTLLAPFWSRATLSGNSPSGDTASRKPVPTGSRLES